MALNINKIALAALSVAVLGLAAPVKSMAQDDSGTTQGAGDSKMQKIDLDLESSNLYYGLKLLFSQVKANFTIDESLNSLTVTAHLTQVPFRTALETLLKSTSTPLTYKIENGIYSVLPKVETVDGEQIDISNNNVQTEPAGGWKFGVIRPGSLSAADIVQAFGGHIVTVGYTPTFGQGGLGGSNGQFGGFGGGGGVGSFGSGGSGVNSGAFGNFGNQFGNSGTQFESGGQPGINPGGGNNNLNGLRGH